MKNSFSSSEKNRLPVAISTGHGLEETATFAGKYLAEAGFDTTLIYTDIDDSDFEIAVRNGQFLAVLDLCTAELHHSRKGPNRLTAAGIKALPQVISVGGLDFHSDRQTGTTPEEMDRIGKDIVEKACAARGLTRIVLPLKGISNRPQQTELNQALFQSIRNWVYPPELLVEFDMNITESEFAKAASDELTKLIRESAAN